MKRNKKKWSKVKTFAHQAVQVTIIFGDNLLLESASHGENEECEDLKSIGQVIKRQRISERILIDNISFCGQCPFQTKNESYLQNHVYKGNTQGGPVSLPTV